MVIGAGWEQERLIQAAKQRGHWVLATAWPPTYADALPLADIQEIVDPRNLNSLWQFARRYNVKAIVADQCDYSYYAAAYIADRARLPGAGIKAAQVATNKYRQRIRLEKSGVPQPHYHLCSDLNEVRVALKEIGYPAIFKPSDNRGNFGVNKVEAPEHVPDAFYDALANSHSRTLLVEKFIDGVMTTVEGFMGPGGVHRSLVSSSKVMLGGRKRIAMELRYPAELPAQVTGNLMDTNQKAMRYLNYGIGPTHAEYMVTPEGRAYFIEAANRGGGVLINSHIVPAITGIDPTEILLDYVTGKSIDIEVEKEFSCTSVVLSFFGVRDEGTVSAIENVEKAQNLPGVLALRVLIQPGSEVKPIITDAHRHGFVIAQAKTLAQALAVVEEAKRTVRICVQ